MDDDKPFGPLIGVAWAFGIEVVVAVLVVLIVRAV